LVNDVAKEYPIAPLVGVGGVIVQDHRAVIVQRGQEPRKGEWSLPGGLVELGESLVEATRREMKEETGLDVEVGALVEIFDRVHHDAEGRVRYHFVIVDYLCVPIGGTLLAGSDVTDARWVALDEIDRYVINPHAAAVLRRGLSLAEPPSGTAKAAPSTSDEGALVEGTPSGVPRAE
jgi:8-oxo-dGTP diphosphatase